MAATSSEPAIAIMATPNRPANLIPTRDRRRLAAALAPRMIQKSVPNSVGPVETLGTASAPCNCIRPRAAHDAVTQNDGEQFIDDSYPQRNSPPVALRRLYRN